MNCREFLARHTEYVDGAVEQGLAAIMRAHAQACASCARYDHVVRRGAELARQLLPAVELSPDFGARMQHRLFHVRDDMAQRRMGSASLYVAAAAVMVITVTATMLTFLAERTPVVDGQVAWAVAPPVITPLVENAKAVRYAPALQLTEPGVESDVASIEAESKGHDPHVASPAGWPVYSRGAVAVAFPASRAAVVVRPADFRGSAHQPLLIRH
jgi:hypothetical protein